MFIKPANGNPKLFGVMRNVSNTEAHGAYNLRSGDTTIKVIHDPQLANNYQHYFVNI